MRHRGPLFVSLVALTIGTGLAVRDARACSCGTDPMIRPTADDSEVPINTKIWIGDSLFCPTPMISVANQPVTARTLLQSASLLVLEPPELAVGDVVSVQCPIAQAVSFVVTSESDTTPPEIPVMQSEARQRGGPGNSCGNYEYVPYTSDSAAPIFALDIAGQSQLDQLSTIQNPTLVGAFVQSGRPGSRAFAYVGNAPCSPATWEFHSSGDARAVRFSAFDLAGNFSGWTAPRDVHASGKDASCTMRPAGKSRGAALAFLCVALFALGRRARKRRGGSSGPGAGKEHAQN